MAALFRAAHVTVVLQNGLDDSEGAGEPVVKLQGSQAAASRAWLVLARMTWVRLQFSL